MLCLLLSLICLLGVASGGGEMCSGGKQGEVGSERCFIMLKPDSVARGLVGQIIQRFERKGFKMLAIKFVSAEKSTLEKHYEEHIGKSFFPGLIEFMMSGPVVPMVWQGSSIVQIARSMLGATDPVNSAPGTIRGDLGVSKQMNLCHVSDSVSSAEREVALWFNQTETVSWADPLAPWKL